MIKWNATECVACGKRLPKDSRHDKCQACRAVRCRQCGKSYKSHLNPKFKFVCSKCRGTCHAKDNPKAEFMGPGM